jgi:hypothetical protein
MDPATILTAVSVLGNLILAAFSLWQKAKTRKAEEQTQTVAEGLAILQKAIEDAKTIPGLPGKIVTGKVKAAGREAVLKVNAARSIVAERASA